MKKRILYYIWMACAAVLLHSCEDVETHKPYGGWQWTCSWYSTSDFL